MTKKFAIVSRRLGLASLTSLIRRSCFHLGSNTASGAISVKTLGQKIIPRSATRIRLTTYEC